MEEGRCVCGPLRSPCGLVTLEAKGKPSMRDAPTLFSVLCLG